ncbi:MAG: hypothetical protein CMJ31_02900 [Phycisphaerae bacterium]|nr:hypothetical protein [Phycisphaerae bacterium]
MSIDEAVTDRVSVLCRVAGIVRHDMGNFLYPSASAGREAQEGGVSDRFRRYARDCQLLVDTVDEMREALRCFRLEPSPGEAKTIELREWWPRFNRLGNTLLDRERRCSLDAESPDVEIGVPASVVSVIVAAVFAAIELRAEERAVGSVGLSASPVDGRLTLRVLATEEGGDGPMPVPSLASRIAASHGGSVSSRLGGKGTLFEVSLPRPD